MRPEGGAPRLSSPVGRLLRTFSWQELRHHGLRHSTAVLAVLLGVALAFAVHLINASALSEFSAAVRSVPSAHPSSRLLCRSMMVARYRQAPDTFRYVTSPTQTWPGRSDVPPLSVAGPFRVRG
mgnify:CR=1 FL=1